MPCFLFARALHHAFLFRQFTPDNMPYYWVVVAYFSLYFLFTKQHAFLLFWQLGQPFKLLIIVFSPTSVDGNALLRLVRPFYNYSSHAAA